MKVFCFHLKGKLAHFRKYYSNSTALSYTIPPRTTVIGIIAGLLGMERDSYYEDFNCESVKISIKINNPIKKIFQKMNLLMIKSIQDLNGRQPNHSQTPTELIIPQNIISSEIDYKIWVHFTDKNLETSFGDLTTGENSSFFRSKGISLGLGTAYANGWVEYENCLDGKVMMTPDDEIELDSSVPVENIKDINIDTDKESSLIVEEIPLEFSSDRMLTEKGKTKVLINLLNGRIDMKVKTYILLNNGEKICWLEKNDIN